jgi:hypothetical protein
VFLFFTPLVIPLKIYFFFIFDDFCNFVRQNKVSIDSNIYIYIETKICKPFKDKIKKQINLKKTKEEEEALFKLSVFYCFSHNPFMGLRTISILTLLLDFVE